MAGIYIHIPFCKQACTYCNFHFSTNKKNVAQLVLAIAKEMDLRKNYIDEIVDTIYFGGGTPSILPVDDIVFLIDKIKEIFTVNSNAEITLEANPDDINETNLLGWKKAGVNRFSLGIQSFVDSELQWMNRSHNAQQAKNCIELIQQYFNNYSIDLIFGSQLLSNEDWLNNIETALFYNPPHLSCYALTIEEKTLLGNKVSKNILPQLDNEKQAQQFEILMQKLDAAGFHHYEISNYAKPGFESKHNSSYWKGKHYLGLGPSAHSFNTISRSWNIANNALYVKLIENNELALETEILTHTQQLNECLMIALRTSEGINKSIIKERFGEDILLQLVNKTTQLKKQAFIIETEQTIILTKQGKLYADAIAADLFF